MQTALTGTRRVESPLHPCLPPVLTHESSESLESTRDANRRVNLNQHVLRGEGRTEREKSEKSKRATTQRTLFADPRWPGTLGFLRTFSVCTKTCSIPALLSGESSSVSRH